MMDEDAKNEINEDISNEELNPPESASSEEEESFTTCDNAVTETTNYPPECSDDSDESENEQFLSDNVTDEDTDISDPGAAGATDDHEDDDDGDRNTETSFQRELLEYLGSLFSVGSRVRGRESAQPVTVDEGQLAEYGALRTKVSEELKVLGLGVGDGLGPGAAGGLGALLAARERGDWSGCRRAGVWGAAPPPKDFRSAIYGSRWAARRLGLEARFPVHTGCVNALHFSASGDWLASGSDDRAIVITDWQHGSRVSRFEVGHTSNVFQVRFLPGSGDLEIVSCSRDKSVRYAALSSTGQLQYSRVLAKHTDCCHKTDVPLDQPRLVLSAGEDCCVLATDVRAPSTNGPLCVVEKVPLYSISCNPVRSQELAVAGKDSHVHVFDRRQPKRPLWQLCPERLAGKQRGALHVTSVVYSGDGNRLLASYNDDDIYLLSARSGSERVLERRYCGHRNVQTVTGVAFYGPRQEFVVSGSNDGHLFIWDRETEAIVHWLLADEAGVVNVLEAHPTMPVLATAGLDHDVKLWSMLGADHGPGNGRKAVSVDGGLLERDQEASRIDLAWRKLDEVTGGVSVQPHSLPFDLRNLQVITALNWKMRSESTPYSFDNTLENLIFMSRRHGENHLRDLFISDSDSEQSAEAAVARDHEGPEAADRDRPDGCRPS